MNKRTVLKRAGIWGLGALGIGYQAQAADTIYPSRPVKVVVPSTAGGPMDALVRLVCRRLEVKMGATFYVENKPGANLQIASSYVAKYPPDGYTILTTALAHVVNPLLYRNLSYDPLKDLTGVAMMSHVQMLLVANAELPVRTVADLIAWGKGHPERFRYGTSGNGSGANLAGELLSLHAGVKLNHIAYKGTSAALPDLLSGRIEMMIDTVQLLEPHIRSGKIRPIAFTGAKRSPALPEVPTLAEVGYPQVIANAWTAIVVPGQTPKSVIDKLSAGVNEVLKEDEVKRQIASYGMEVAIMIPDEVNRYFESETNRWAQVIKAGNIKVE